ncbi:hypothetical protein BCPG3_096 [Bacillus phage BCPG3]|uniref:Uncharacterized protein n=3 Tax=Wphvirus TaxID=1922327 RepID=W5QUA1_9CAUD|nr:hypothetical protein [Bacillus thuringiensis]YP_006907653.1 hypothetical protein BPS13_0094 [Bacillus phage BPS13]YP_009002979.1 hypothetical protein BPS10C_093 [Bacillus phage BPS10C]YP_009282218.1 hypothetical protein SALINJAH_264 [Bacillus phage SalinJah]QQO38900.1 hypothetical protein BCPG1_169 [Bacillus phage BCPG1]QSJ04413.1 hypothetical protein BCPG3_096 [Bacillus phage BCPG3]QSJ04624.1 hypothetical protein BCP18_092 [Bacillus phage BCP18]AEZ50273.1 hypothetical protein BPS13_0094 
MKIALRMNNIAQVMEDIKEAHEDVESGALTKVKCVQLIADCRDVKMSLVSELWDEMYKGDE